MAKTPIKTKDGTTGGEMKPGPAGKYQDMIYILAIALLVFVFFSKAIFSGGFNSPDNVSSNCFATYVQESQKDGNYPQWIPYVFGGMPSYASMLAGGTRSWDFLAVGFFDVIGFIGNIFASDVARMICYYIIYGIGLYILMRSKKQERYIAFFVAVAGVFSTYVITWVMIGHNTKPIVFAMFPYVILFLEKLREKFSILFLALLVLAIHIMLEAGHIQMMFYGGLIFGTYLLFEFINRLVTKTGWQKVLLTGVYLVFAAGVAFMMSSDRYMSTLEYTPYSTRGVGPIVNQGNQQDAEGGNAYDYATMWSFSPGESMTFFVPGYYGKFSEEMAEKNINPYWGYKESEDSPPYMGIVVLAFAIVGFIFYRKDAFVQAMFVIACFSLLLSFGRSLPLIYDLFYYNFPGFNKFRAPSMALAMMHFSIPVLAGYGLTGILNIRKNLPQFNIKTLKVLLYSSLGFLGIGIIFAIGFKKAFLGSVAAKFGTESANLPEEMSSFFWSAATSDWFIGALILIVSVVACYMFIKNKMKLVPLIAILLVLLVADMWRVDFRRMQTFDKTIQEEIFAQYQPLYDYIKKDKSLYRIFDFVAQQQNIPAYFLVQNVNGYHSAKMRVIQDIMDVANQQNALRSTNYIVNPLLWNIMNVKYIIQPSQQGLTIDTNHTVLPRAFFVDSAVTERPLDILYHLRDQDFNPQKTAYLESSLPVKIDPVMPGATAEVKEYKNEKITIDVNATGNNLLFIGEVYYPPAWKAYIDGKETTIYKTNYAFRSIVVPQGKHLVTMEYRSEKFETGRSMSTIANIATTLALVLGVVLVVVRSRKTKQGTDE